MRFIALLNIMFTLISFDILAGHENKPNDLKEIPKLCLEMKAKNIRDTEIIKEISINILRQSRQKSLTLMSACASQESILKTMKENRSASTRSIRRLLNQTGKYEHCLEITRLACNILKEATSKSVGIGFITKLNTEGSTYLVETLWPFKSSLSDDYLYLSKSAADAKGLKEGMIIRFEKVGGLDINHGWKHSHNKLRKIINPFKVYN